ncbi:MAG: hypothetical protein OXC92_02750 [Flavobacteriaceae bacterium]|nr:hypothetical protein [Flavobacteriaceae bacterium]MCY4215888.1 hypothetical protein [Flavobacteriaceae bacterium]MCY4253935.1 hypothetical protein [Flavobacteriaceae bacterium]
MVRTVDNDVIEVVSLTVFSWLSIEFLGVVAGIIFGTVSSSFIIWKWRKGIRSERREDVEHKLRVKKLKKELGEDSE